MLSPTENSRPKQRPRIHLIAGPWEAVICWFSCFWSSFWEDLRTSWVCEAQTQVKVDRIVVQNIKKNIFLISRSVPSRWMVSFPRHFSASWIRIPAFCWHPICLKLWCLKSASFLTRWVRPDLLTSHDPYSEILALKLPFSDVAHKIEVTPPIQVSSAARVGKDKLLWHHQLFRPTQVTSVLDNDVLISSWSWRCFRSGGQLAAWMRGVEDLHSHADFDLWWVVNLRTHVYALDGAGGILTVSSFLFSVLSS